MCKSINMQIINIIYRLPIQYHIALYLTFKKISEGLEHLKVHALGQPANIVVCFDGV